MTESVRPPMSRIPSTLAELKACGGEPLADGSRTAFLTPNEKIGAIARIDKDGSRVGFVDMSSSGPGVGMELPNQNSGNPAIAPIGPRTLSNMRATIKRLCPRA